MPLKIYLTLYCLAVHRLYSRSKSLITMHLFVVFLVCTVLTLVHLMHLKEKLHRSSFLILINVIVVIVNVPLKANQFNEPKLIIALLK